jgi:DnaJ family protein A protein 5
MKAYVEPEWSNVDKKLKKLDLSATESEEDDEEAEEEEGENAAEDEEIDYSEDELFCVACDKAFKNEKSKLNHENSKKHKENIELLRVHMEADDEKMANESKSSKGAESPRANEEVDEDGDDNAEDRGK